MSKQNQWRTPRKIVTRLVIKADLVLQTAAHFGNGDHDPFNQTDMMILRDALQNRPLLPGASIAGALRSYLREFEQGYHEAEGQNGLAEQLFGGRKSDESGLQSPLIIYDSMAQAEAEIELRDGVKIEAATRVAESGHKFDLEVLVAGTVFPLHFELVMTEDDDDRVARLRQALVLVLQGLENEAIRLGARKKRGYGKVKAQNWRIYEYDLTQPKQLLAWLTCEQQTDLPKLTAYQIDPQTSLKELTQNSTITVNDARHYFQLEATFLLASSMLIRSNSGELDDPDMVYLKTKHVDGRKRPLVPGTSLAGVTRHRALRIAKTLFHDSGAADKLVHRMFGYDGQDKSTPQPESSRVQVDDAFVIHHTEPNNLVQNRVKLDRFTGGSYPGALFSQLPVWGTDESRLTLRLALLNPQPAEVGLLLHVLKDMWTSDLPIGGEASVGRGRLSGKQARLVWQQSGQSKQCWQFERVGDNLNFIKGQPQQLDELFGKALGDEVNRNNGAETVASQPEEDDHE